MIENIIECIVCNSLIVVNYEESAKIYTSDMNEVRAYFPHNITIIAGKLVEICDNKIYVSGQEWLLEKRPSRMVRYADALVFESVSTHIFTHHLSLSYFRTTCPVLHLQITTPHLYVDFVEDVCVVVRKYRFPSGTIISENCISYNGGLYFFHHGEHVKTMRMLDYMLLVLNRKKICLPPSVWAKILGF